MPSQPEHRIRDLVERWPPPEERHAERIRLDALRPLVGVVAILLGTWLVVATVATFAEIF